MVLKDIKTKATKEKYSMFSIHTPASFQTLGKGLQSRVKETAGPLTSAVLAF